MGDEIMKTTKGTRMTAPTQDATSRLKHELMNDALRGVSPGRARDTLQRSGSFEPGHKKRGGRKKGSRNVISPEHKRALLEVAHRVGSDGNGRNGIVGYFTWVAERDLTFFYVELWSRLLELQIHDEAMSATNEPGDRKKQPMTFELREGPDDEVRELMSLAIMRPKQFCKSALRCLADAAQGGDGVEQHSAVPNDAEAHVLVTFSLIAFSWKVASYSPRRRPRSQAPTDPARATWHAPFGNQQRMSGWLPNHLLSRRISPAPHGRVAVRVLSAPPRSRILTEISRLLAKTAELTGLRAGAGSL